MLTQRYVIGSIVASVLALAFALNSPQPKAPAPRFAEAERLGRIENKGLDELSGLEASFYDDDLFWAHGDDKSTLYAIDSTGDHVAKVDIRDTSNVDWEDMTSFEVNETSYLLIADTGANRPKKADYHLICIEEPQRNSATSTFAKSVEPEWTLQFRFPDKKGRVDCEAVAADGENGLILLLTKEENKDDASTLYSVPLPNTSVKKATASRLATIDSIVLATANDSPRKSKPTSLDIRNDGRIAIVLTHRHAYAFVRKPDVTWREAFLARPILVELPEMEQPEAICFDHSSQALIVTSERGGGKRHAPVFRIPISMK